MKGSELKELRLKHNVSQADIFRATGISAGTVASWESRDADIVKMKDQKALVSFFKSLEIGVVEKPVEEITQNSRITQLADAPKVELSFIPRLARASLQLESYSDQDNHMRKLSIYYNGNTKDLFVIEIGGDSMEPQLQDGQLILGRLVNRDDWKFRTGVVGVMFNNYFVVKRVKNNDLAKNGTLQLISDNPLGGEITIGESDIQQMWHIEKKLESDVI